MKTKIELKQQKKFAELRTTEIHKFPINTHLSLRIKKNFFLAAQLSTHFYIIHTRLYINALFSATLLSSSRLFLLK